MPLTNTIDFGFMFLFILPFIGALFVFCESVYCILREELDKSTFSFMFRLDDNPNLIGPSIFTSEIVAVAFC